MLCSKFNQRMKVIRKSCLLFSSRSPQGSISHHDHPVSWQMGAVCKYIHDQCMFTGHHLYFATFRRHYLLVLKPLEETKTYLAS